MLEIECHEVFGRFAFDEVETTYTISTAATGGGKRVGELIVRTPAFTGPQFWRCMCLQHGQGCGLERASADDDEGRTQYRRRGKADAPLLSDLISLIQDFFEMMNGVAASMTGDDVERFDWRVVGLSKNSPARVTVEAFPLAGHSDGAEVAGRARDVIAAGLEQLKATGERPLHFTDNVVEAADRFTRRVTAGLAARRHRHLLALINES